MSATDLTDFDLHLFGEGNHHHIHRKLGAHLRERDGVRGTRFAVWAPNARRVSVVGDFNHWNGRSHVMQRRATSGVWELFVPQAGPGTLYKFEIDNAHGHVQLKADPFAFQMQLRPQLVGSAARADQHLRAASRLVAPLVASQACVSHLG
jgi:1,4-alpha-glucan branching enzyme